MARIGLAVGWAILQIGGRDKIFQYDLLALGDLVELVEIDQREGGQSQVQVVLVLEVDAVVVILTLVPGQQDATERGLATALTTYKNRLGSRMRQNEVLPQP